MKAAPFSLDGKVTLGFELKLNDRKFDFQICLYVLQQEAIPDLLFHNRWY